MSAHQPGKKTRDHPKSHDLLEKTKDAPVIKKGKLMIHRLWCIPVWQKILV